MECQRTRCGMSMYQIGTVEEEDSSEKSGSHGRE
jgi:hypothetical protein